MRKLFFLTLLIFSLVKFGFCQTTPPAFGRQESYGKLTIYSDVLGADIYVDAKFVGQDRASISNIPAGKHYVRVAKGEVTVQSGLVEVREGEETIIVAKPTEEEFLARMKKPNHLFLFGGFTSVGYSFSVAGVPSFTYSPQLGLGVELKYPIPVIDVNIDLGFLLNSPANLHFYDTVKTQWADGKLSISSPYICASKELFKLGQMRISGGGGFNYALYTPGGGVQLSIEPRLGYMGYIEGFRGLGDSQKFLAKLGYVHFAGKAGGVTDIWSSGYFLLVGIAYQI